MTVRLSVHEQTARLLSVALTDEDDAAIDLTGLAITFSISENPGEDAIVTKTTDDDVTITTAASGAITVQLAEADLPRRRNFREGRWEAQLHPGDDVTAEPQQRVTGIIDIHPSIA